MPRKKKTLTIDVNGMSVDDILNMDIDTINRMGLKDIKAVTSRLVSVANKRIRRFEQHDIESPSIQALGTRTKFSVNITKNLDVKQQVNKMRQEFSSVRNFLTAKTSTMSGYKKYIKELKEDIAQSVGVRYKEIKNVDLKKVYSTLHKLQERGIVPTNITGKKGGSKGSLHARDYIVEKLVQNDAIDENQLLQETTEEYTKYYEEQETTGTDI